jgi:signal transduction histidine kinase
LLVASETRSAVEFKVEIADDLLPVSGDPGQLQQAIIALATNALDAMGESGVLTITGAMTATRSWSK